MRQRQHGLDVLRRLVVVARWVDVGRRHDDRRVAAVLEPVDQLERCFFQMGERELVVVVLVAVVPAPDARHAVVQALGEHDGAAGIELRDVRGVQPCADGDADEVGTELARFSLDLGCRQRFPEYLHSAPSGVA